MARSGSSTYAYSVQSIERALDILESVSAADGGISVKEVSARLGLPFSTVHRIMALLAHRGYLEQDKSSKRYWLGMGVLLLRGAFLRTARLEDVGYTLLRELARATGEACHLAVLYGGEVVYVRTAEGSNVSLLYTPPGKRAPVHCTSLGKAMLSRLPLTEVRKIVEQKGLPAMTPNTIRSWEELVEELARVRERGYAVDDEEFELGVRCIGAPVLDYSGRVVAAISVAGPSVRLNRERWPELALAVMRTAEAISSTLGHVGEKTEATGVGGR